jgi:hypothetical protein
VRFASLLVALAGCDQVFLLTHVEGPADAKFVSHFINDPTGDYDQDGDPNGSDLCPTLDHMILGANIDSDGDGVGDACDPHPMDKGDCLVLFDDFAGAAPDSIWKADGGAITTSSDQYRTYLSFAFTPEEVIWLDGQIDLDAVTVLGYPWIGDQGGPPRSAVEIYVAYTRTPGTFTANGDGCAVESSGTSDVAAVHTLAGNTMVTDSTPIGSERVGAGYTLTLSWAPSVGVDTCAATLNGLGQNGQATIAAPIPPSEVFALRGINVGLHVYAIEGWGHSCPAH